MLSKLFGTNVRVKILKQTLLHPNIDFSPKKMAKNLNTAVASIKRELENLEKFGLLLSQEVQNASKVSESKSTKASEKKIKKKAKLKKPLIEKMYRINTDFVLYSEVKALIMKSQILYEKDFVEKIKEIGKVKVLIFAGFFVNDDASSVDLLIVGQLNKQKLIKMINELEGDLGREVNYTIMSEKEFKYRSDVTDVFLYSILEGKKMVSINVFNKEKQI
jgi:DNA-binding transcriptional regulator YhcF (GntR family)